MVNSTFNNAGNCCDAVLTTLQYYSLFKYPLKAEEIYGNLPVKTPLACLLIALEDLDNVGIVYKYEGFYCISKDVKEWVVKRRAANGLAQVKKKEAIKAGRFIYQFPFVRFVAISGSLSKGYADEKSDFDFFVVTAKNRLWICRTLLHLFKKATFLFRQQHKFCMNYFIDTHDLQIEEKNRFTAIELASIIPVSGYDIYMQLNAANSWVEDYFPNEYVSFNTEPQTIHDKKSMVKTILEFIGDHIFPELVNKKMMQLTDKKWKKKWSVKNYPMEDYDIAFKTTLHVSKNHPANHQKRVLNALAKF